MNLSLRLVTILNCPMDQEKLQADQVRFQDHGRPMTNPKWLVLDLSAIGDIQLYRGGVYFHGSYIGSHQEATPSTFPKETGTACCLFSVPTPQLDMRNHSMNSMKFVRRNATYRCLGSVLLLPFLVQVENLINAHFFIITPRSSDHNACKHANRRRGRSIYGQSPQHENSDFL